MPPSSFNIPGAFGFYPNVANQVEDPNTPQIKYELIGRVIHCQDHFTAELLLPLNKEKCTYKYNDMKRQHQGNPVYLEKVGNDTVIDKWLTLPNSVSFWLYKCTSDVSAVDSAIKNVQDQEIWKNFSYPTFDVSNNDTVHTTSANMGSLPEEEDVLASQSKYNGDLAAQTNNNNFDASNFLLNVDLEECNECGSFENCQGFSRRL